MKLAFSTLGCPDWSFPEILSTAKDMGYDGVEIRGIKNELYAPEIREFHDDKIDETCESLKSLNLSISCLTTACYLFDKQLIDTTLREGYEYIDLAQKLNVPYIRVLGDRDPQPSRDIDDAFVRENLKKLADYGKDKGVMPLLETNGVYADSKRIVNVVEGLENVGILWDIHHPCRFFRENPADTYSRIKQYVKYVHFKDSVFDSGTVKYKMPGYGDLPIRQAINLLIENDFDGYVSLEWVKRWYSDLEDPGVVFMHFVHYIKKIERKVKKV